MIQTTFPKARTQLDQPNAMRTIVLILKHKSRQWNSLPITKGIENPFDYLTGLFLSSNRDPLTLQSPSVVLGALSSARQSLTVAYASVALNLLESPYIQGIEPPQISFNHVLGDFISDNGEFFFRQIFGDFVIHVEVD